MAKTNHRPIDKIERKQRLAQRLHRQEDDFDLRMGWNNHLDIFDEDDEDDVADEISSSRTNRAY